MRLERFAKMYSQFALIAFNFLLLFGAVNL